MLATMSFNIDFSSPHRPAVSSPLSSSPLRLSQSSPPLSPRDPNRPPRRDTHSSPIQAPPSKFKFASRNCKPNPLRLSREKSQENRRTLFMKNVRQRADDRMWEKRGGDQEVLILEWKAMNRKVRDKIATDLDGVLFEEDIDDIPVHAEKLQPEVDDKMVDVLAQEEEEELNAMLSLLDPTSSAPGTVQLGTPSLSDDEDYDSLFIDILKEEEGGGASEAFMTSGQMDMS
ncbi:hypothetical protein F5Y17DRAFT_314372 [Xylariaceae sp. FL0594]|nr:hypothetical protein F5Y17DRAFT_314372 [Xylariaceae sp. FL0594]